MPIYKANGKKDGLQKCTWLIDAWTPDGMLSMNLTDSVNISGSLPVRFAAGGQTRKNINGRFGKCVV